MKHDLRLLAWYFLLPLYVIAIAWLLVGMMVGFVFYLLDLRWIEGKLETVASWPVEALESVKPK